MYLNPDKVPSEPVYTVIVTAKGKAVIDGEEVEPTSEDPRVSALDALRIKAAWRGRAIRVTAKESDGSIWPMIVDCDGSVTTLDHPHSASETPSSTPDTAPASTPSPQEVPLAAADWYAPLPAEYAALWSKLREHEEAGALIGAIITADRIENSLVQELGAHHPHTVNVMTARAYLTMQRLTEWAETTELLISTTQRRREARAPQEETERLARNAHATWRKLTKEDPKYALEIADQLMTILGSDQKRAQDVIRWVESGAARGQGAA